MLHVCHLTACFDALLQQQSTLPLISTADSFVWQITVLSVLEVSPLRYRAITAHVPTPVDAAKDMLAEKRCLRAHVCCKVSPKACSQRTLLVYR